MSCLSGKARLWDSRHGVKLGDHQPNVFWLHRCEDQDTWWRKRVYYNLMTSNACIVIYTLSVRKMRTLVLRGLPKVTWLESSLLKVSPELSLFSLTFFSVLCIFQRCYSTLRLGNISTLQMEKLMWRVMFKDAFNKCYFRVYMNRVPKFWAVGTHRMGGGYASLRRKNQHFLSSYCMPDSQRLYQGLHMISSNPHISTVGLVFLSSLYRWSSDRLWNLLIVTQTIQLSLNGSISYNTRQSWYSTPGLYNFRAHKHMCY